MVQRTPATPQTFYEADETGWLEATAELVRAGRLGEVDTASLAEYLTDMSKRDRREVMSRLVVLLAHLLKYEFQSDQRSASWRSTVAHQRLELEGMIDGGTLRRHAEDVFAAAYEKAIGLAAADTGLARDAFPAECPWTLDEAVGGPDLA